MSHCPEFEVIERFFITGHAEEFVDTVRDGDKLILKRRKRRFNPPSWHCGGPIPKTLLFRPENIQLLYFDLIPAVDIVYAGLSRVRSLAKTKYDEHVGIRLIPKVLHACARRNIAQNFAPGILLMYVEFCEKCEWRDLLPRICEEKRNNLNLQRLLKDEAEMLHRKGEYDKADEADERAKTVADWNENMVHQAFNFLNAMHKKKQCVKVELNWRI